MRLDPWAEQVRAAFRNLCADPEMMRHAGNPLSTAEADALFERATAHWATHGFGWRSAVSRESGDWLGFFVLNFVGSQTAGVREDEISVGWWILPRSWGHGYAREGATAICIEAFERVGAERVVAFVQPGNTRSVRVADALGMELATATRRQRRERTLVYELQRSKWENGLIHRRSRVRPPVDIRAEGFAVEPDQTGV
jgi:RimJ/RimL family protein N-acetyltransferase